MLKLLALKTLFFSSIFLLALPILADPMVIAHRGGKTNWPENTIYAFKEAERAGVNAIELDVQVSKDGVVVLYHPKDLSEWTNGSGPISERDFAYIQNLNAVWKYKPEEGYPLRSQNIKIPTLKEVLDQFKNIPIIVDMKSLPAEPLVKALVKSIPEDEWKRLIFYSTNPEHLSLLKQAKPHSIVFEDRSITRARLLTAVNSKNCQFPTDATWLGFELKRSMEVKESFALGESSNKIDFELWIPESIDCTHKMAKDAKVVLFGINTTEDWIKAKQLNADAVYTDNPLLLLQVKK